MCCKRLLRHDACACKQRALWKYPAHGAPWLAVLKRMLFAAVRGLELQHPVHRLQSAAMCTCCNTALL